MKHIDACWNNINPVVCFLLPVSAVFYSLVVLRKWLYRIGVLKSTALPVPVVVVGNIAVGGTGKTPLLIALCGLLKSQGINVGIVSRGYRGNFSGEKIVDENDTPLDVGDEPFIIARNTKCPVSVGKNRVAASKLLYEKYKCDIILSDDGLQHYAMRRDYEIAVVDAEKQHGNRFLLPAGPLREPVSRLNSTNMIAYNGETSEDISFRLIQSDAVNLLTGETKNLDMFAGCQVHAIAGIGNPSRFFEQLRKVGFDIVEHIFSDHHDFSQSDLVFDDDKDIVMTEKDAVKCGFYKNGNAWYIPVVAALSESLSSKFITDIRRLLDA